MVLSKSELIASFHHEVHVLLHLAGKIDRTQLDYRPTPKQRSTFELIRYLSVMGPALTQAGVTGTFDREAWAAEQKAHEHDDLDALLATIAGHAARYSALLEPVPDAAFRDEVEIFGRKRSRGAFLVNTVLANCVGYRMQLFLYLKSCGREELATSNLWHGVDPAPPKA
jgi:hypothetical protein